MLLKEREKYNHVEKDRIMKCALNEKLKGKQFKNISSKVRLEFDTVFDMGDEYGTKITRSLCEVCFVCFNDHIGNDCNEIYRKDSIFIHVLSFQRSELGGTGRVRIRNVFSNQALAQKHGQCFQTHAERKD
jgi:hypothetical protein